MHILTSTLDFSLLLFITYTHIVASCAIYYFFKPKIYFISSLLHFTMVMRLRNSVGGAAEFAVYVLQCLYKHKPAYGFGGALTVFFAHAHIWALVCEIAWSFNQSTFNSHQNLDMLDSRFSHRMLLGGTFNSSKSEATASKKKTPNPKQRKLKFRNINLWVW